MIIDMQFDAAVLASYFRERVTQALADERLCITAPIMYPFSSAAPEPGVVDRVSVASVSIDSDVPVRRPFGVPDSNVIYGFQRMLVPEPTTGVDNDHTFSVPAVQVNVDVAIRLVPTAELMAASDSPPDPARTATLGLRVKLLMAAGLDAAGANLELRPQLYDLYVATPGDRSRDGLGRLSNIAPALGISLPPDLDAALRRIRTRLPSISVPVAAFAGALAGGTRLWNAGARVRRHPVGSGAAPARTVTLRLQFGPSFPRRMPPAVASSREIADRRAFAEETEAMWHDFHDAGPPLRITPGRQCALFVDKRLVFAGMRAGVDLQAAATAGLTEQGQLRVTRGSARPSWTVTERGSELELGFDGTAVRACTVFWDIDLNVWLTIRGPIGLADRPVRESGRLVDVERVIRFEFAVEGGLFTGDAIGCGLGGFLFGDLGRWILYLYTRGPWYEVLSASVGSTFGLPLAIVVLFAQAFDPSLLPALALGGRLPSLSLGGFTLRRIEGPGPVRFAAEISVERLLRLALPGIRLAEVVPSGDGLLIAATAPLLAARAPELELDTVAPSWRLEPEFGCTDPRVAAELTLRGRNDGTAMLAFCPRSSMEASDYVPVRFAPNLVETLRDASIGVRPLDVPPGGSFAVRVRLSRETLARLEEYESRTAGLPPQLFLRIQTNGGQRLVAVPWPLLSVSTSALDRAQERMDLSCRTLAIATQAEMPIYPMSEIRYIPGVAERVVSLPFEAAERAGVVGSIAARPIAPERGS